MNTTSEKQELITPDMTVLDIISKHRHTEAVFKCYDEKAGECICCKVLFETVQDIAKMYNLNLDELLNDLRNVIEPE